MGMMARILVVEPHAEVRELLERVVRRLGNEPVRAPAAGGGVPAADAAIVEPAFPGAEALLRALRHAGVPTVCVSIYPPSSEVQRLQPVAYLLKPFTLAGLEGALEAALSGEAAPAAVYRRGE